MEKKQVLQLLLKITDGFDFVPDSVELEEVSEFIKDETTIIIDDSELIKILEQYSGYGEEHISREIHREYFKD